MSLTATPELPFRSSLSADQSRLAREPLSSLFTGHPQRQQRWTFSAAGLTIDVSRNYLDETTFATLIEQLRARQFEARRDAMLAGEPINRTEARPAWHTALRTPPANPELATQLAQDRERFLSFADQARQGQLHGATGKTITSIICIGIGGSDLGPRLVTEALGPNQSALILRFVSNIDPSELDQALLGLNPETTLVVAISKSFTTLETLENLKAAQAWFGRAPVTLDLSHHLIAVTSQPERAAQYGFSARQILGFADWVGGRYSLWSACGLPIALAHGSQVFRELLRGAALMDSHFAQTPLESNLPVILGVLGAWYINYWGIHARAVFPYAQRLRALPAYLQQLEMESLGKHVDQQNQTIAWHTSPVVWGEVGTSAQHSVFQFLHQGTHWNPADFLLVDNMQHAPDIRHRSLYAAGLAQIDALAWGDALLGAARSDAPYAKAPGGRPGNLIHLSELSPAVLGALLAMYEHRCFVQSVIWDINAFDQWGVEVGKKLLQQRMNEQSSST